MQKQKSITPCLGAWKIAAFRTDLCGYQRISRCLRRDASILCCGADDCESA